MKKAFSLVELMVVIAIVGLLSAVAVPAYRTYMDKVKISRIINIMQKYQDKIVMYYNTNGALPTNATGLEPTTDDPGQLVCNGFGACTINSSVGVAYKIRNLFYGTQSANVYVLHAYLDSSWSSALAGRIIVMRGTLDTTTGIFKYDCGTPPTGGAVDIPTDYLPATCNTIIP